MSSRARSRAGLPQFGVPVSPPQGTRNAFITVLNSMPASSATDVEEINTSKGMKTEGKEHDPGKRGRRTCTRGARGEHLEAPAPPPPRQAAQSNGENLLHGPRNLHLNSEVSLKDPDVMNGGKEGLRGCMHVTPNETAELRTPTLAAQAPAFCS